MLSSCCNKQTRLVFVRTIRVRKGPSVSAFPNQDPARIRKRSRVRCCWQQCGQLLLLLLLLLLRTFLGCNAHMHTHAQGEEILTQTTAIDVPTSGTRRRNTTTPRCCHFGSSVSSYRSIRQTNNTIISFTNQSIDQDSEQRRRDESDGSRYATHVCRERWPGWCQFGIHEQEARGSRGEDRVAAPIGPHNDCKWR